MIKRLISQLQEKADSGDEEAHDAMRRAGLWQAQAKRHEHEAEYHYPIGHAGAKLPEGA